MRCRKTRARTLFICAGSTIAISTTQNATAIQPPIVYLWTLYATMMMHFMRIPIAKRCNIYDSPLMCDAVREMRLDWSRQTRITQACATTNAGLPYFLLLFNLIYFYAHQKNGPSLYVAVNSLRRGFGWKVLRGFTWILSWFKCELNICIFFFIEFRMKISLEYTHIHIQLLTGQLFFVKQTGFYVIFA